MSTVIEDRNAYKENFIYYNKKETGDFTPFYITVTICTILGLFLFVLNITLGCCSRYSRYWNDRHTGNRWIVSFWTSTPHNQPALDYKELEDVQIAYQEEEFVDFEPQQPKPPQQPQQPHQQQPEFVELQKRESEI